MWTTIGGFDYTGPIPFESINLEQTIGDPFPSLTFDVRDDAATYSFNFGDEVIVWNEVAPAEPTTNPAVSVAATPAHNLVQLPSVSGSSGGAWATTGALSIISSFPGLYPVVTFSNTTYSGGNNYEYLTSITPAGYIHAGQQYMFSIYATISNPLTNAQGYIALQFQDGSGNLLGSPTTLTFASTTNNALQRLAISATAPTNAAYAQVWFGGRVTTSGTNSGTINYGTPQLEPMFFASRGVSYPTPDCNYYQADCATMPDGTTSRMVRFFSGFIQEYKKEYIGSARTWHIQCAGAGALAENGLVNASYTNQYDSDILTSIINTYFAGQISINAPNTVLPAPLTQGALISSISFSDNSLREIVNSFCDSSGYIAFVDPYYRLYYQSQYSSNASFMLSDSPDNVTSFPYYAYELEVDGTQVKRRIKINGGQFSGHKQDLFSGNGSTKQFSLTYIPEKIAVITVGGSEQRVGVYGRDSFAGPYDVLVNVQGQYILFNSAPTSGTNNVVVTYTYKAPISTQTSLQTTNLTAPGYAQPLFDAKVNDSNIVDLTTATTRGLAEITKYGMPLVVITCSSQQFASAGQAIFFTSTSDGILNQPYVVQRVTGTMIGKDVTLEPINEFRYQLGAYQPTLHDHVRNANKAMARTTTVANITAAQQFDFVALDTFGYRDSISATTQPTYSAGKYGTGKYGQCSYGGATGTYGSSSAQYGRSTIYG